MFIPPVLVDTNVFVAAAFNDDSSSAMIISAAEAGELRLVWNQKTRDETLHILGKIPPVDESRFVSLFDDAGHFPGPTRPEAFDTITDPDDRKFAALAEATATVLVSNDSDVLAVRRNLPITVWSPSEFVEHSGIFDS